MNFKMFNGKEEEMKELEVRCFLQMVESIDFDFFDNVLYVLFLFLLYKCKENSREIECILSLLLDYDYFLNGFKKIKRLIVFNVLQQKSFLDMEMLY